MRASRLRSATPPALGAALALGLLFARAASGAAQSREVPLPFAVGEAFSYRAVSSRFGSFGTGSLRVQGPEEVRGHPVYHLHFEFEGRVGPFRVRDDTHSWLAPREMRSVRYQKRERSPLGSRTEEVDIDPVEGRWTAGGGLDGPIPTPFPLDELSFLYYIRTLPLTHEETHVLVRHFDVGRNPVHVRVLGRERTRVPAGEFSTIVVEMRVRDPRVFAGDGTLRLYLTDDERRIPVRIESSAPWIGATRLLLVDAR